jgi:uncharacterized protein YerC
MHWNLTDNQRLLTAIMLADTSDLLQNLLIDLLTQDEFNACATRLTAMCLLHDGASYKEIQNITGMSPKTISRLSDNVYDKESGFNEIMVKFKELGRLYPDKDLDGQ